MYVFTFSLLIGFIATTRGAPNGVCQDGAILPSSKCLFYKQCVHGQFLERDCGGIRHPDYELACYPDGCPQPPGGRLKTAADSPAPSSAGNAEKYSGNADNSGDDEENWNDDDDDIHDRDEDEESAEDDDENDVDDEETSK